MNKYLFCILFVLLIFSCTDPKRQTDILIEAKLNELRQNLIEEKTKACDKQILAEIELMADSILITLSKRIKYDSLTIPYDSIRPAKPEIKFPEYKKPVKPGDQ